MLVSLENSVSSHESLVLIQTLDFLKTTYCIKVDGVIHKKNSFNGSENAKKIVLWPELPVINMNFINL